jgi:dGTPase
VVSYSDEMQACIAALKTFLHERMYSHFRIVRMAKRAEQFLSAIFASLTQEPRQLPDECKTELATRTLHRVVADYIASMTDRGALLEYRRLHDPLMRP